MDRKELGIIGEDTAARLLSCKGYEIIERNFRCRYGEIDIIASKFNELYFVEVKTRQGHDYGRPCEAITGIKQEHIRKAALFYLDSMKAAGYSIPRFHFHAVEIVLEHMEDIF